MPTNKQPQGPNYSVKSAETVAAGNDLRVRLFTLAPGEVIPWHFHSEIVDEFFVLEGELTVETRAPDDCRVLGIGERFRVNAQHAHQTVNRGAKDAGFSSSKVWVSTTLNAFRRGKTPKPAPRAHDRLLIAS